MKWSPKEKQENNETIREKYASKETFKSAAFQMFLTKKNWMFHNNIFYWNSFFLFTAFRSMPNRKPKPFGQWKSIIIYQLLFF